MDDKEEGGTTGHFRPVLRGYSFVLLATLCYVQWSFFRGRQRPEGLVLTDSSPEVIKDLS